ncbi:MAG: hypothetical protein KIT57_04660 [Blastocatellales bacterium]|nr:hypothetical protein [Blastocatellales bacterium]
MPRRYGAGRLIVWLSWLCILAPEDIAAQSFSQQKVFGRYQQVVWTEEHGLPQNTVRAILRASDGYLWIGTLSGAARFDGVRFTLFNGANSPDFKGSYIEWIFEDRQKNLWIGAENSGLMRFSGDRFRSWPLKDTLPHENVVNLYQDRRGTFWGGTHRGLLRFEGDRFTVFTTRDGLPHDTIEDVGEDPEGNLWIATGGGLSLFKDGRFTNYTQRDGIPGGAVQALAWDRSGTLWVGSSRGLARFRDGRFTVVGVRDGLFDLETRELLCDREGNLWIGTLDGGLFYRPAGAADDRLLRYTPKDGLPSDRISAIYQDPDGDIWIGLNGGLMQLRTPRFQVYTPEHGLANDFIWTVFEDSRGAVWAGTATGLSRLSNGRFTTFTIRDGLCQSSANGLGEDSGGNVWTTTAGCAGRFNNGEYRYFKMKDGLPSDNARVVYGDRTGQVWIGTLGGGLTLYSEGRFTNYTEREGLLDNDVRVIYEDRAGALWLGCRTGFSRFKDGRFTNFPTKDLIKGGGGRAFYEDHSGNLWIYVRDGGLLRYRDGKFTPITTRDGLYDATAYAILPDSDDDSGNLWMTCDRGVFRVSLKDLNDFADGRTRSVVSFAYGLTDGLLTRECNGGAPGAWRARDGRLWFATAHGVAVTNPKSLNTNPPLVAIEGARLERERLPFGADIRVNPGQEDLEIDYTGLSWSRPKEIRFRYRLIGLDREWVDAGMRRTAYFPYLPPGEYTFQVIADNGEGVWNETGSSLRITVVPPFYRTWWFTLLGLALACGLAAAFYKVRVNRLRRLHAQQEAFSRRLLESQESERKRIAAELHDSIGQNLLIIKNRALMGLAPESIPSPTREQLDDISAISSQAIEEVREIAFNLRPYQIDRLGLSRAIEAMVKKVAASSGIRFELNVAPLKGLFTKEAEISLYRIAQECVNNIVKHSAATDASVAATHRNQAVELRFEDNGKGFVVEDKTTDETGKQGFGLAGMAERVRILGGVHRVASAPGRGTTITITIAVQNAPQVVP